MEISVKSWDSVDISGRTLDAVRRGSSTCGADHVAPHFISYTTDTSPIPYLACECESLILGDLLQQLLALAVFFLFFALINFSLQLLKLQILQTFSLLLLFLVKQEDKMTEKSMTGKYSVRFSAGFDASEHRRCKRLTDQFTPRPSPSHARFQVIEVFPHLHSCL